MPEDIEIGAVFNVTRHEVNERKNEKKRDEMTSINVLMSSGISERGVSCIRSLHWSISILGRLDWEGHTGSGLAFDGES